MVLSGRQTGTAHASGQLDQNKHAVAAQEHQQFTAGIQLTIPSIAHLSPFPSESLFVINTFVSHVFLCQDLS
jgi:hypothetical protein